MDRTETVRVLEVAESGEWALGEAGIVRRAALGGSETILAATGDRPLDLERAVTRMRWR